MSVEKEPAWNGLPTLGCKMLGDLEVDSGECRDLKRDMLPKNLPFKATISPSLSLYYRDQP